MMIKNYDESGEITHNSNWPDIPDYPYRTFTTGCSESDKTNVAKLQQPDIDKVIQIKVSATYQRERKSRD